MSVFEWCPSSSSARKTVQVVTADSLEAALRRAALRAHRDHCHEQFEKGLREPDGILGYYLWVRSSEEAVFRCYYAATTWKLKDTARPIYTPDPTADSPQIFSDPLLETLFQ